MLQSMVDSQVEAEGWEAPPEAALDRGSLHTALQVRLTCAHCLHVYNDDRVTVPYLVIQPTRLAVQHSRIVRAR